MFKILNKEYIIDNSNEHIPYCWLFRDVNQDGRQNNYFNPSPLDIGVWVSGKDKRLLKTLINSINSANELICLSTYIFSEPNIKKSLLDASNRGVRIYILTASNKHLKNLPDEDDDDFNIRMYEEMLVFFSEMQGKVKIRTSENFHSKFLLIDPLIPRSRKGFLLTSNFDTKGIYGRIINNEYRVNPEICVYLSDDEIIGCFNQFCYGFWEMSTEESIENSFLPIKKKIIQKYDYKEILLNSQDDENSLKKAILDLINENIGSLIIATYIIKKDNEIYEKVLDELRKNREVVIFTRPKEINTEALKSLADHGAKIYGHFDIHAKIYLNVNENNLKGIITTGNIEALSFTHSFETGKHLNNKQAKIIFKILNKWREFFPLEFKKSVRRGVVIGKLRIWDDNRKKLENKEIFTEKIIKSKPIYAHSIENYEDFVIDEKELKQPDEAQNLYQKLRYEYEVYPPLLPENAKLLSHSKLENKKEKKINGNFQIYKALKDLYIVVKDKSEIEKAKNLAEEYNARIVTKNEYLVK